MNYNTLKASYPTKAPYPKEELGLGGKDCKELGISSGDGSDAGYRLMDQNIPHPLIYNDISKYPFSATEKWLNGGGKCFGQKWICTQDFTDATGIIYSINVVKCTEKGLKKIDLTNACNVSKYDKYTLPECAHWGWVLTEQTGWPVGEPDNTAVIQECNKAN